MAKKIVKQDDYVPQVHKMFISRNQTETMTGKLERKMGTMRIISTPPEAHIIVDEKDYGLTPNVFQLPTGSYSLRLSKEDFRDYEETVTIEWNKTLERNLELPTGPPPSITWEKDGAEMMLIPAGEFEMGDHHGVGDDDEKPVHTVYVDAFYMDKYEVTNAQYAKFLNDYGENEDSDGHELIDIDSGYCLIERSGSSYRPKSGYENHPVIEVSWYGANAYAEYYGKRLPTEAEWEKAARGGLVGKKYPWGDVISHDDANYSGTGGTDQWNRTSPVGSFPPNGYGLYDMAGNVWEWCNDWYDSDYYSSSPRSNPLGPSTGRYRLLRGGSWGDDTGNLRVASRDGREPGNTYYFIGFRCCVSQDVTP